jgi:hypothetical protein
MAIERQSEPSVPGMERQVPAWFGVRTFTHNGPWPDGSHGPSYEERVTLWRASSPEEAIELAIAESESYAEDLSDSANPVVDVGLAQSYELPYPPRAGAEVFSLIRYSDLEPAAYMEHFFDTGAEVQEHYQI